MSETKKIVELIRHWSDISMKLSMLEFKEIMSTTGISFPQMGIMMRLSHRGDFNISEVGEQMGVTNAAASQTIDRMVGAGLIERTEDPVDRRSRRLALTEKGKEIIKKGFESRGKWMEEIVEDLNPEQQEKIIESLTLLSETALKSKENAVKEFLRESFGEN